MPIEFQNNPLDWGVEGVEPSTEKKAQGFANGEAPAAGHWDHKFRRDFLVQKELQEKVSQLSDQGIDTSTLVTEEEFTSHKTDYVKHPGTGTTTNTGNAYAVTLNPAPSSYVDKMGLILTINADSTGASTINVNGLGAKAIKKSNGNDVTNIKNGGIYSLRYNASTGNFILQGEGSSGNATASDLLSGKTASTDAGDIIGTMPNKGVFNLGLGVSVPPGYYSGGITADGKKSAVFNPANVSTSSTSSITISGFNFVPTAIIISATVGGYNYGYGAYKVNGAWGTPQQNNNIYSITVSNISDTSFDLTFWNYKGGSATYNNINILVIC